MAGERTLAGLGLTAFWDLGSNGWKPAMDLNILTISALLGGRVISRTTSVPATPADGDMYIIPVGDTDAGKIYIQDNGAGVLVTPPVGFEMYVADAAAHYSFNGTTWDVRASGGGATTVSINDQTDTYALVLADASKYVRLNKATAVNLTVPANATVAFPVGTVISLRQVGAGQVTVVAAGGVTINTAETLLLRAAGSSASLIKVAADVWDISGDLEAA